VTDLSRLHFKTASQVALAIANYVHNLNLLRRCTDITSIKFQNRSSLTASFVPKRCELYDLDPNTA